MTPYQKEQLKRILDNSALLGKDIKSNSDKLNKILIGQQMILDNQVILEKLLQDFSNSIKPE